MKTGFYDSEILLPNESIDLTKWSTVACDQFTSEPRYWDELKSFVGKSPSMLNIVYPEVYLSKDNGNYIKTINANMNSYLDNGILDKVIKGAVLTIRSTPHTKKRVGIVGMIDLECYSYIASDKSLIRATEGTILDRIPPRVKIRENAVIESPHIMLLIDDKDMTVIEPIYSDRKNLEKLYDFDLNMNGGHISGYHIKDTDSLQKNLQGLLDKDLLVKKYGDDSNFLFAVGDGNHSLATAKTCWENIKKNLSGSEKENHPARFALVEIVNIYDEGISFEPIHRVAFTDSDEFLQGLKKLTINKGYTSAGKIITEHEEFNLPLPKNATEGVTLVQNYIDECLKNKVIKEVDYVHGLDSVIEVVGSHKKSVGIILNGMDKNDLFYSVSKNGALTRKTFSMGEAIEKRYYLECRRIK